MVYSGSRQYLVFLESQQILVLLSVPVCLEDLAVRHCPLVLEILVLHLGQVDHLHPSDLEY